MGRSSGGNDLSSAPMMKKSVPMPIAEMSSESLRPSDSTKPKMKIAVATTLMMPYTPDASSEFFGPV